MDDDGAEFFDYLAPDLEDFITCDPSNHSRGASVEVISAPDADEPEQLQSSPRGALPALSEASRCSWEKIDGFGEFSELEELTDPVVPQDTADDVAVDAAMFDDPPTSSHVQCFSCTIDPSCPWGSGVHAAIFSDDFQLLPSGLPEVAIPPASSVDDPEESEDPVAAVQEQLKRRHVSSIADRVIRAVSDIDYKRQLENLWDRALNKWILVYTCVAFSGDIGTRIWQKIVLEQDVVGARAVIRDVVGNKAPRTVNKRAGSMLSLFDWLHGLQKFSWPLVPEHVLEYMGDCPAEGKGHTRGKSLMEAFRSANMWCASMIYRLQMILNCWVGPNDWTLGKQI